MTTTPDPNEFAWHGESHIYDQDGLRSIHNHEFMDDAAFRRAYERGVRAAGDDYLWHWRVHTGSWAAHSASGLDGDFVECGVNRGFLSTAIMDYLDWDIRGKQFYLLDTFAAWTSAMSPKKKKPLVRARKITRISQAASTRRASNR